MQHFPIFVDTDSRLIVVSGGGEAALAKLRLLLKTRAWVAVYAPAPLPEIVRLAADGRLALSFRPIAPGDADGALLVYAANDEAAEDARAAALGRAAGALVNIVDNLADSGFITPAIVDRDPVVVAIGTEGAAPVLARALKAELEKRLPARLGVLARLGKAFRHAADALPMGRARRAFWSDYYFEQGPRALESGGEADLGPVLDRLLEQHLSGGRRPGRVDLVSAGDGDPELLTLKARKAIDAADVIIHDRAVAPAILELARREAVFARSGGDDADAALHARKGLLVVRLMDGAAGQRLRAETAALDAAGIDWALVPGIAPVASPLPRARRAANIGSAPPRPVTDHAQPRELAL